jgi:hypothetical protein
MENFQTLLRQQKMPFLSALPFLTSGGTRVGWEGLPASILFSSQIVRREYLIQEPTGAGEVRTGGERQACLHLS